MYTNQTVQCSHLLRLCTTVSGRREYPPLSAPMSAFLPYPTTFTVCLARRSLHPGNEALQCLLL